MHGVASELRVRNERNARDKVFARVLLNDTYQTNLKVDTASDTCAITKDELYKSGLDVMVKPNNCILRKYGVVCSVTDEEWEEIPPVSTQRTLTGASGRSTTIARRSTRYEIQQGVLQRGGYQGVLARGVGWRLQEANDVQHTVRALHVQ